MAKQTTNVPESVIVINTRLDHDLGANRAAGGLLDQHGIELREGRLVRAPQTRLKEPPRMGLDVLCYPSTLGGQLLRITAPRAHLLSLFILMLGVRLALLQQDSFPRWAFPACLSAGAV